MKTVKDAEREEKMNKKEPDEEQNGREGLVAAESGMRDALQDRFQHHLYDYIAS